MKTTMLTRIKAANARLTICLTALLLCAGTALAQNGNGRLTVAGRAVNATDGTPVDYASVLLLTKRDTSKVFGITTDDAGRFEVKVPKGDYQLRVSYLGFETTKQELSIQEDTELDDVELNPLSAEIATVVVTGELIVREADRFVVNVGSSPAAIGQTASDMLRISPGVWVDERNGISINGKSGTKVMINERYVQETGEDLVNYLNTIKAEDIVRIEVIPMAGVEYDADAQGGIIKITLKKQREKGLEGSVSMRYGRSMFEKTRIEGTGPGKTQYIQPSITLNYMVNKFRFYTTISENNYRNTYTMETLSNPDNDPALGYNRMVNLSRQRSDWPSLRVGAIYDINNKHSVGVEANLRGFFPSRRNGFQTSWDIPAGGTEDDLTKVESDNGSMWKYKNLNLSANYIAQLDSLGSTFKLLADYHSGNNYNEGFLDSKYFAGSDGTWIRDSYSDYSGNRHTNLYSITGDFDVKAGKLSRVKAGVKYSFRDADGENYYQERNEVTQEMEDVANRNYETGYNEHIAALYGNFSTMFWKKLNVSVGVRGEYTNISPWQQNRLGGANSGDLLVAQQSYFSLFPNANISATLGKNGNHMLILAYNRRIGRPWYSNLLPTLEPISEYIYFTGNPDLKPSFSNDLSLSYVIARKYNLTVGVQLISDGMTQAAYEKNGIYYLMPDNVENTTMPYANLNIPAQVTKWWKVNTNLTGLYMKNTIEGEKLDGQASFQSSLKNDFTLAKNFYYDVEAKYNTAMQWGNMRVGANYSINTGFRYVFHKGKMTANVYVNDLFNTGLNKVTVMPGGNQLAFQIRQRWSYRRLGLAFRYNFKSGKEFKVKNVESGEKDNGGSQGVGGIGGGGGGGM